VGRTYRRIDLVSRSHSALSEAASADMSPSDKPLR